MINKQLKIISCGFFVLSAGCCLDITRKNLLKYFIGAAIVQCMGINESKAVANKKYILKCITCEGLNLKKLPKV